MFPPWACAIWQSLAHGAMRYTNAFASPTRIAQDATKALAYADGLFCDDCYPSPYPWPGPVWVRPFFAVGRWRRIADVVLPFSFGFHLAPNTVVSASIKTINRGSVTCGNRPFLSWRFARLLFQLVLTMIFNAVASARLVVRLLPMRLVLIPLPGLLSAALVAWFVTIWASAGKQPCISFSGLRSENYNNFKAIRANRPDGFLYFRRADGTPEGQQCSRKY